ncbi:MULTISPECIES: LLM class flavin-dependent oxidoreductase [Pseudonocardia]|uniref:F420-dependent glucose-6-phosphate dehydrogenase n=2 Tax=Pseudonocardia TaxID=1847 RepID=A0A1Y2MIH5_PSEAH|nr:MULTISPECIES: LLM class flavin-dependent oxidoreductase [Pseudonocardia]OSY34769.1 F420-dependent glucose-6-phosphate dehydrogenase [Pseudonocardia autotrophica]TDN76097.1 methylenetetrahydromethanopterin reductase [Pseudonocardia autotrophica]BBG00077.1 LLM class F420-dependent oxidoreductase [Pseudonocardia autotrophica]GEC26042.1 LLM class F420-dependent oxidoreductase [Pseudonocardia saturnea]
MSLTFSIRLNNDLEVRTLIDIARVAEAHGFDQIWVSNDLFLRSGPIILSAIAQHTERIRIGSGILNPYSIHPSEIAMMAATLQEVSGGRFLLGLGAGAEDFLDWAGLGRPKPLTTTREAIIAIRALLAGKSPSDVPGSGVGWTSRARLAAGEGHTPIYVGGMSPKMLAMAGAHADGVLPLLYPPEHFATAAAQIADGAREAGRTLADIDLPACFWCCVDDDPERASAELADKIAYYGASFAPYLLSKAGLTVEDFGPIQEALADGDTAKARSLVTPTMLGLGIAGGPDAVILRCRGLMADGATHLSFGPPLGLDPQTAVHTLGERVLPAIRAQVETMSS